MLFALTTLVGFFAPFSPWIFPDAELEFEPRDIGFAAMAAIELIGLYGFVTSKKIGTRNLWKFVIVASAALAIYSFLIYLPDVVDFSDDTIPNGFAETVCVVLFVLWVPVWVALYRYIWTESQIWVKKIER